MHDGVDTDKLFVCFLCVFEISHFTTDLCKLEL
jgi:hypothetical protein